MVSDIKENKREVTEQELSEVKELLLKKGFIDTGIKTSEDIRFGYDKDIKKYVIGFRTNPNDTLYWHYVSNGALTAYMSKYIDNNNIKEMSMIEWIYEIIKYIK